MHHRFSFRRIADLLFPVTCLGCRCRGAYLCPACWQRLARGEPQRCPGCGREQPAGRVCTNESRAWDGITGHWHVGPYHDPLLREAIRVLKYESIPALALPLAGLLAQLIERLDRAEALPRSSRRVIVPVPMDRRRRAQRGFNHAAALTQQLARLTGWPSSEALRKQPRPPQATLDPTARETNLTEAFSCVEPLAIFGKTVILVDDVLTTGATARGCAAVLRAHGAHAVWILTLARG